MTSTHLSTPGGCFGKQSRFYSKDLSTPGPIYNIPSLFTEHTSGPIYKPVEKPADVLAITLPRPSKDRTAWMIGTTKDDLAYFSDMAAMMGPAMYNNDPAPIKRRNERTIFGKDPRFQPHSKQYVAKELNDANLCTAGPGPKYYPQTHNGLLTNDQAPLFSFRSKGDNVADRGSFLKQAVINGYIYQARPSTSDPGVNVGPSNYSADFNVNKDRAPRPIWGKSNRFQRHFIGKKFIQDTKGKHSPGPAYMPENHSMGITRRVGVPTQGVFLSR